MTPKMHQMQINLIMIDTQWSITNVQGAGGSTPTAEYGAVSAWPWYDVGEVMDSWRDD